MIEIFGKTGKATIMIDDVEDACIQQLYRIISSPLGSNDIVIMPDCHAGAGSTIGYTQPFKNRICPSIVGVDISCGMLSAHILSSEISLVESDLDALDIHIRTNVPMGMTVHTNNLYDIKNHFPWKEINELGRKFVMKYNKKFNTDYDIPNYTYEWFTHRCWELKMDFKRAVSSIGTLGGGNHFIEIGKSDTSGYWITVHTGSRNFGKVVCEYHQTIAEKRFKEKQLGPLKAEIDNITKTAEKKDIEMLIKQARAKYGINFDGNFKGLEYLEGADAMAYFIDMIFAQMYAKVNRAEIMNIILKHSLLNKYSHMVIETVHNFIDFNDFIIRKGAIRSYIGEPMIIPFNMRDGILVCEGKSNIEWNCSAPHGAGRLMSRSKAKKEIAFEDFKNSMVGIYSTSVVESTLDESPFAYKDSNMIENAIIDTATIIDRIKPILNIKDNSENSARFKKRNG